MAYKSNTTERTDRTNFDSKIGQEHGAPVASFFREEKATDALTVFKGDADHCFVILSITTEDNDFVFKNPPLI